MNKQGFELLIEDISTYEQNNSDAQLSAYNVLINSTGSKNSAFGSATLFSNNIGYGNSAFGKSALYNKTAADGEKNPRVGLKIK